MKRINRTAMFAILIAGLVAGWSRGAIRAQTTAARGRASSLVPSSSPAKPADRDGFLRRWLILEPIRVNGQLTENAVRSAAGTEPLSRQIGDVPRAGDTITVDGAALTWHAVDTIRYNVNLFHFAYALNKPTSNVLFWIATVVNAPREMGDVRLAIGSNAASLWWVNGREVIGIYNDRQTVIDDGVSKRLTLKQGPNVIRGAIVNAGGATDFCARFLDGEDRPVTTITTTLTQR